ncbi:MAG: DUF2752 domain-containing protein [Lachnospiraceae bacterium]|nr:DUF2752 domain-containing protein [Lachnospiraceae bacterium]
MNAFDIIRPFLYCRFKQVTGLYCPGCGGTRALELLLRGEPVLSLYYHAGVLYFFLLYIFIMGKTFVSIHFGRPALKDKTVYVLIYTGIGIVILQWLIKLFFLIVLHQRLI